MSLPDFITFDETTREITVQTNDTDHVGRYQLQFEASVNGLFPKVYYFTLDILQHKNTGPPFFTNPLRDTKMIAGQVLDLKFPSIDDPDQDKVGSVLVNGLQLPFVTSQFPNYKLKPKNTTSYMTIYVSVTLKDDHPEP